jgi:hypothetical protein
MCINKKIFISQCSPWLTLTLTLSLFNQSKNHLPPDLAADECDDYKRTGLKESTESGREGCKHGPPGLIMTHLK